MKREITPPFWSPKRVATKPGCRQFAVTPVLCRRPSYHSPGGAALRCRQRVTFKTSTALAAKYTFCQVLDRQLINTTRRNEARTSLVVRDGKRDAPASSSPVTPRSDQRVEGNPRRPSPANDRMVGSRFGVRSAARGQDEGSTGGLRLNDAAGNEEPCRAGGATGHVGGSRVQEVLGSMF